MPQAVSRKQYRMMMTVMHGKVDASKSGGRSTPPKSVASKYTAPGKDAPEQNGENRGGTWDEKHHTKAKGKVKEERIKRKKDKKKLKKAFEDHYEGHAAGTIVMNDNNQILLGRHCNGGMAFAGGHMDVADGSKAITALRELNEETGLVGHNPQKVWSGKLNGNQCDVFLVESFTGEPQSTYELKNPRRFDAEDIPWDDMRDCCYKPLEEVVRTKLGKSLRGMMAIEKLEKNVIRQKSSAVLEVTHGNALRLVGNGMFRKLRDEVKGMGDEDFKDVKIDTYTLSIRQHINDIYSGRVIDGHKMVYQFTNNSLPELTAALISVFECYLPKDKNFLDSVHDDAIPDDVVYGGVQNLIENYKRHNIGNIYQEMETIREQLRNGMAVDLQQVEARIMTLFDKLEEVVHTVSEKHNHLSQMTGSEIDELARKLRELQSKIDEMGKGPETITAVSSSANPNPARIHDENYPYLPRPQVEISPNGAIKITFAADWQHLEKENFLRDMKAKVIKSSKT